MKCDAARRLLSDRLDHPIEPIERHDLLDAHVAACDRCRSFARRLDETRRHLRLSPVGEPPDVASSVRAALEDRPASVPSRRWWQLPPAAAAFTTAVVLAATVVGLAGPPGARATDVSSLVLSGQHQLRSLVADVEVVEHGWHPEVAVRHYTGRLSYAAPETMSLELTDRTAYPSGAWRPNDVAVVVDGPRSWGSGLTTCPTVGLPECTPSRPRVRAVEGREPFDAVEPVPLDLVLPVASFVVGGDEEPLGRTEISGRTAVGVEVTAAQVAPLLDGVRQAGNWRPLHPTDAAQVWLDEELGVPLRVEVHAAGGPERDRWAAVNGLDEPDEAPLLSWELHDVRVNEVRTVSVPQRPDAAEASDRGFREGVASGPRPAWLPDGMEPHRSGTVGGVEVTSFSDGRAWVTVRSTDRWGGGRLFGQHASVVRRAGLGEAGTGYVVEGGDRVLVHGDGIDVEVVGSLPTADLLRLTASLGIRGEAVPDSWAEASTATLEDASAAQPGLLTLAGPLEGYRGPAVSVGDEGVVQSFAGGGERAFVLSQSTGGELTPPMDAVVLTVEVRDHLARYTPGRGTLEWVEHGATVTLRSQTLALTELVAIAGSLEPAP